MKEFFVAYSGFSYMVCLGLHLKFFNRFKNISCFRLGFAGLGIVLFIIQLFWR